jgi:hypothetical protein
MTTADLPIQDLRRRLAQASLLSQSTGGSEAVYRELIGFVPPPCADARDATTPQLMLHSSVRLTRCRHPVRGLKPFRWSRR